MKAFFRHIALPLLLLALALPAAAQGVKGGSSARFRRAEAALSADSLHRAVAFFSGPLCNGRRAGSEGVLEAARYLRDAFRQRGLKPLDQDYLLPFELPDGGTGYNVSAALPGSSGRWIVVGANLDHLGRLSGVLYPGADMNASGVAGLIGLSDLFHDLIGQGHLFNKGIILVGFDGKEQNLAGSTYWVKSLTCGLLRNPETGRAIHPQDIDLMINLDQIGSSLAPGASGREDYLIALTGSTTSARMKTLQRINEQENLNLELIPDYYGSADFTRIFYRRISDQRPFLEKGIPAVMFTSGITDHSKKPTDRAGSLNYPLLRRRLLLIYYFLVNQL